MRPAESEGRLAPRQRSADEQGRRQRPDPARPGRRLLLGDAADPDSSLSDEVGRAGLAADPRPSCWRAWPSLIMLRGRALAADDRSPWRAERRRTTRRRRRRARSAFSPSPPATSSSAPLVGYARRRSRLLIAVGGRLRGHDAVLARGRGRDRRAPSLFWLLFVQLLGVEQPRQLAVLRSPMDESRAEP